MVDLQQGDLLPQLWSWLHLPLVLEGGLSGPQHLLDLPCVRYCAIQRMRMFRCLHECRRTWLPLCTFSLCIAVTFDFFEGAAGTLPPARC